MYNKFQEPRFAKLGYTAATILYHVQDYQAVLEKTKSNNQLVQACHVYLQCECTILGLVLQSWFTYKITNSIPQYGGINNLPKYTFFAYNQS